MSHRDSLPPERDTFSDNPETGQNRNMGRLDLSIKDDLEKGFRSKVYERKGMKKGNLTEALEEAVILWVNTQPSEKKVKSKA